MARDRNKEDAGCCLSGWWGDAGHLQQEFRGVWQKATRQTGAESLLPSYFDRKRRFRLQRIGTQAQKGGAFSFALLGWPTRTSPAAGRLAGSWAQALLMSTASRPTTADSFGLSCGWTEGGGLECVGASQLSPRGRGSRKRVCWDVQVLVDPTGMDFHIYLNYHKLSYSIPQTSTMESWLPRKYSAWFKAQGRRALFIFQCITATASSKLTLLPKYSMYFALAAFDQCARNYMLWASIVPFRWPPPLQGLRRQRDPCKGFRPRRPYTWFDRACLEVRLWNSSIAKLTKTSRRQLGKTWQTCFSLDTVVGVSMINEPEDNCHRKYVNLPHKMPNEVDNKIFKIKIKLGRKRQDFWDVKSKDAIHRLHLRPFSETA